MAKAASRTNYIKRRWVKIAAAKANYQQKKEHVNIYCRGKYPLNEPKAYIRQQYAAELQKELFLKTYLIKQSHENIARKMSKGVLTKTVCRITPQRLLDRVFKKRREIAGQLLSLHRALQQCWSRSGWWWWWL